MKLQNRSFVFYLSGLRDNDTAVQYWIHKLYSGYDTMLFKLPYTPPYQDFESIRAFQIQSRFHPFTDTLQKEKLAVIDLSEWIGVDVQLDYLEIFFQFLHDYHSFYHFQYIFTVGAASRNQAMPLCQMACRYLASGRIHEDHMFTTPALLASFLQANYPLHMDVALGLAKIFAAQKEGPAQIDAVVNDLLSRVRSKSGDLITKQDLLCQFDQVRHSKAFLLYERELLIWKNEKQTTDSGRGST
ncbi:hypothetical protein [Gemmiger sp. An50]|uniref:hypothetical protein n=1 Tax=Gemmiger sp. An50 TaxID=1965639 RepID=UPI000B3A64B3|nr:hypothetical protein [Gemmiger sp. An50]OUN83761.1 hypothetical protein B5G03_14205 [Gemmiger sp. An50]